MVMNEESNLQLIFPFLIIFSHSNGCTLADQHRVIYGSPVSDNVRL